MKKIFLPLLAAVGMALGLTLSSCGGGGSDATANEPARALTGITLTCVNTTPGFDMVFKESNTGWIVQVAFTPGGSVPYIGYFSVDQERPPKLVNGMWEIWGSVGFVDNNINNDNQFRSLVGINPGAYQSTIERFVMYLQLPSGSQNGAYAGSGVLYFEGNYWMTSHTTDPNEQSVEKKISFETFGIVKEQFLLPFAKDEEADNPFDY